MLGLIIILILAGGGGVTLAAERALPDQMLYPVKIEVTEKVRELAAFSDENKIKVAQKLLERRLKEMEELALKKRLNGEVASRLQANFAAQANRVLERIKLFEARDPKFAENVTVNFETALKVHERILTNVTAKNADAKESIEMVGKRVREKIKDADDLRKEIEKKISALSGPETQSAAEGKLKTAENKLDEVRKFLDKLGGRRGLATVEAAEMKFTEAKKLIADGKKMLIDKKWNGAFKTFTEAHRLTQEAKLLAEIKDKLDVGDEKPLNEQKEKRP